MLSDDFLKEFKNGDELNFFLVQIQKQGIVKMLEGELVVHLVYNKHEKSKAENNPQWIFQKENKNIFWRVGVPGSKRSGCLLQSYGRTQAPEYVRWA